MLKREKGRPENVSDRLAKEIRVYDLLDDLGIEYERVDHPAAMTMEACEEIDRVLEATICKNLLLCNRQQTDFYLLLMPGDKKFVTRECPHNWARHVSPLQHPTIWRPFWTLHRGR